MAQRPIWFVVRIRNLHSKNPLKNIMSNDLVAVYVSNSNENDPCIQELHVTFVRHPHEVLVNRGCENVNTKQLNRSRKERNWRTYLEACSTRISQ